MTVVILRGPAVTFILQSGIGMLIFTFCIKHARNITIDITDRGNYALTSSRNGLLGRSCVVHVLPEEETVSSMSSTETVASSVMFSIEAAVLRMSSSTSPLSASSYSGASVASPSSLGAKANSPTGPASSFASLQQTTVFCSGGVNDLYKVEGSVNR
ncbi:hypothetical protein PC129_g16599 [Phytophthora cactorum]|uniref:Uncharacterized protein n=1 Tax=Phytophthora cactorum TaxID=29920 RepID=A0A8T1HMD2_9STRA|nr:hypothetical protein PC120_g7113 [Phytophthora cactorum]KAG3067463.1 hypothetical protein PC121_g10530 [Phytophthora cactorum]KAG3212442.1 hypothetical protein PC129_g16599 [Phytophthora cactorum]KAG4043414.1 hypothetical protein PC123_g21114 [Phytophthora cactorum]